MEPLKDLRSEAASRGEAPLMLDAATGAIIPADRSGSGERRVRDYRPPLEIAVRPAEAVPPNTRRAWASRRASTQCVARSASCASKTPRTSAPSPPPASRAASHRTRRLVAVGVDLEGATARTVKPEGPFARGYPAVRAWRRLLR